MDSLGHLLGAICQNENCCLLIALGSTKLKPSFYGSTANLAGLVYFDQNLLFGPLSPDFDEQQLKKSRDPTKLFIAFSLASGERTVTTIGGQF